MTGAHGSRLRAERLAAGLTQQEVAAAMGVDRVTVWRYEGASWVKSDRCDAYRAAIGRLAERGHGDEGSPLPPVGGGPCAA